MAVPRESLDHVRSGRTVGSIICIRRDRRVKKCHACSAPALFLCDHPKVPPEGLTAEDLEAMGQLAVELTTCSRPCCSAHAVWWKAQKHLCREHSEQEGIWA